MDHGGQRKLKERNLIVGPPIALDADGSDGQEGSESLGDVIVQSGLADLLDEDGIGVLEDLDLFPRHLAQDPDGQARSGKRVPADEMRGDLEQAAQRADLICYPPETPRLI